MAKKDNTPKGDDLESIISVQKQEITTLSAANTSLNVKNAELLERSEKLESTIKELNHKVSLYRGALYTITMRMQDFYWCVPSLKAKIKKIINLTNV